MKKVVNTKKQNKKNGSWYSLKEVLGGAIKTKEFKVAYAEELARIELARQIREVRGSRQLTQSVVAKRAGMPQSVIARIESGEHSFSLDTLSRIAGALGKKVELV
ncbi:MAG: helix-turn-helix domain-containing protein [Patescibacteria group bacterium]